MFYQCPMPSFDNHTPPLIVHNNKKDEFFVIWQSYAEKSYARGDSKILGQRLSNTGSILGSNIDITVGKLGINI